MTWWQSILQMLIGIGVGAFLYERWLMRIRLAEKREVEIRENKRKALHSLLERHSEKVSGRDINPKDWLLKYGDMCIQLVTWASDDVIAQYAKYIEQVNPKGFENLKDHEIHLGKAVLAFRKELGYENKGKRITPEHITVILKAGWSGPI